MGIAQQLVFKESPCPKKNTSQNFGKTAKSLGYVSLAASIHRRVSHAGKETEKGCEVFVQEFRKRKSKKLGRQNVIIF
jgi:hypothetical protein